MAQVKTIVVKRRFADVNLHLAGAKRGFSKQNAIRNFLKQDDR
jgi:hypothetical protein